LSGQIPLGDGSGHSITFVSDGGPVVQGVIHVALSPDGHQMEMVAPFRGFMKDPGGNPIVALGRTIDVSFSLEASGELQPGAVGNGIWASDTAAAISGYYLASAPPDLDQDGDVDADDVAAFTACAHGPAIPLPPACLKVDFDEDGDGDHDDFGLLQRCHTGPGVPADLNCGA
jgi:hypothetical protein